MIVNEGVKDLVNQTSVEQTIEKIKLNGKQRSQKENEEGEGHERTI